MRSVFQTHGPLRLALLTALIVWAVTSLVATVEENRTTWLLFALIVTAGRLAKEDPRELARYFFDPREFSSFVPQGALQAWGEGATDDVLPQKWPGAADLWLERTASERKKTEWLAAQIDILRLGS
ncbi:exported hypothetical protein [Candidatus Sulfotelmatomonas gaucii]|uniref:Uncharacterized protein n=1 Tax=Candidatus Sulfuritelmatomonas gaucii TaxID=2043161 RepID=A0A2N9L7J2_9BACT|nr:exported hypothetical protein [Candidatus Sulfotelmatomonas gaucii]